MPDKMYPPLIFSSISRYAKTYLTFQWDIVDSWILGCRILLVFNRVE